MATSFDRWVGKVAVVTGASSGIGAAIVEQLAKEGVKVAALARRKERLDELAQKLSGEKGKVYGIKTDITKEDDILNAFKWIKENLGPIHILVNNAGVSYPTVGLIDGKTELWQNVLQCNVMGLSICTREAIQDMKANKVDGHIIHINSIAGHKITDFSPFKINIYGASKFAVTALAEALKYELNAEKLKIKVSSVSPGLVETEMTGQLEDFLKSKGTPALSASDVANAVFYILSTPPNVQISELTIQPVGEKF